MAMMTLDEFVTSSLTNILKGITAAQEDGEVGQYIAPGSLVSVDLPNESGVVIDRTNEILATTVRFDVGVTAESKAEGGAGIGFSIAVASGKTGGDVSERAEGVNRIQFAVPLRIPSSKG